MLAKFPNLRELNLSDNELTCLPQDISKLKLLANFNLNGNNFENVINISVNCDCIVQRHCNSLEKSTVSKKFIHQPAPRRVGGPYNENFIRAGVS